MFSTAPCFPNCAKAPEPKPRRSVWGFGADPHAKNGFLWQGRACKGLVLAGVALAASACAAAAPAPKAAEPLPPARVSVSPVLVTPHATTDLAELLEQGHRHLEDGDAAVAAERFETARSLCNPTTEPWVLHWAALAHEAAGRHELAAERFELLAARHAEHELGPDAAVRAVRLWGYLERGERAAQVAETWLSRASQLSVEGRVALYAAVALHALESGDLAQGELHVGKARQWIERRRLAEAPVLSRDVATLFFALGELRRLKAEQIELSASAAEFADRFEVRAQLVLDAQSAYLDVMRARDAFWTSRAGFRLGELYTRLHTAVMSAPRPSQAGTDPRLFEGAFRLRYLVLLEKGLAVLDRTLALTERTNERRPWVEAAKLERSRLGSLLAEEQRFLDALPWSKKDLRLVLDGIAARQTADAAPGARNFEADKHK